MIEFELKYGCNPNQKPAKIYMENGSELPVTVLSGRPGYINFLDAFNSWQLVRELKNTLGLPAAASFKHVSPTSAAVGKKMSSELKKACFVDDMDGLDSSPLACAYARARGTDRLSSFGDWIALSEVCDEETAKLIVREVSDGVIAPGYSDAAFALLKKKKKGNYNIVQIDESYEPALLEHKQVFGITFEQRRNDAVINKELLANIVSKRRDITEEQLIDLIIAQITLKYTQSNSVCLAFDGQTIGVGAGQQSRIHCTRLACDKADNWNLRRHEKVLALPFVSGLTRPTRDNAIDAYISNHSSDVLDDGKWQELFIYRPEELTQAEKQVYLKEIHGLSLASDAFFPFEDNVLRAKDSGVECIVQPGGSVRDKEVISCCDENNMVMISSGLRLFHH